MDTAVHSPLPLARYRLFESHDLDEARERVARVFCPHGLNMLRPRVALNACHHSVTLHRDVSLNYVQYGPAVQIDPGYLRDFFLLQIPLRGGAEIRSGAQQVTATTRIASLPSPTEPLAMRWADDSPHLILRLGRAAVLAQLAALLQAPVHDELVFDLGVPLDDPAMAALLQFVAYLRSSLDAGSALAPGSLLAQHAEAYLLTSLLLSAPHNHSAALAGQAQRSLLPRSVRRAQDYMAGHADQVLTLAAVCNAAGCSARSLQQAFRQHLGQGPMDFLRDLRLDRVRAGLLTSPAGVRATAEKYGFVHLGHFAAQYRARFGERPSETHARRAARH